MNRPMNVAWAFGLLLCLTASLPSLAQSREKPIRLAAPGFTGVNVDDKVAGFFSDHFAQRLSLNGITVVSPSEVAALVGLERQKQLMGCSEDASSCLTELANALGADGVITGSVGKFGTVFQINIKVLSATDAKALAIISKKAYSEEDALEVLESTAENTAYELRRKLRSGAPSTSAAEESPDEEPARASESEPEPEPEADVPVVAAPARKYNAVHFNLGSLAAGFLSIEYERVLVTNLSLFVAPTLYYIYWQAGQPAGLELAAGARWYPGSSAPTGFGVGVHAVVGANTYFVDAYTGARLELLFHIGLGDVFVLGLAATGGYNYVAETEQAYTAGGLRLSVGAQF